MLWIPVLKRVAGIKRFIFYDSYEPFQPVSVHLVFCVISYRQLTFVISFSG